MALSREEVQHIATLCRIGMAEADIEEMRGQLSQILDQFEVLREVDVEGVPPTSHAVVLDSVLRADVARPSDNVQDVLANAPRRQDDYFRVRAVVEEQ